MISRRAQILVLLGWCGGAMIVSSGCNLQQIQEAQRAAQVAAGTPSPTPTPSCGDFSEYDQYTDCVTATSANCNSEWQTFSNGGAGLCYYPVAGWESCTPTSADWIYTSYTATVCKVTSDVTGDTHWKARSVIGCSSTVCACLNSQVVIDTCSILGGTCPAPTPSPMPDCP